LSVTRRYNPVIPPSLPSSDGRACGTYFSDPSWDNEPVGGYCFLCRLIKTQVFPKQTPFVFHFPEWSTCSLDSYLPIIITFPPLEGLQFSCAALSRDYHFPSSPRSPYSSFLHGYSCGYLLTVQHFLDYLPFLQPPGGLSPPRLPPATFPFHENFLSPLIPRD